MQVESNTWEPNKEGCCSGCVNPHFCPYEDSECSKGLQITSQIIYEDAYWLGAVVDVVEGQKNN
jgi:hypothetical protein